MFLSFANKIKSLSVFLTMLLEIFGLSAFASGFMVRTALYAAGKNQKTKMVVLVPIPPFFYIGTRYMVKLE